MNETPPPIRYGPIAPRAPEGAIDVESLVPGEGPIEIDVGFGRGRSLFDRAAASPESRIVGIEIKSKWAYKVEEKRRRLGLERVRIFAGDVREIVSRAGPPGCVARVFVHFPDPWWKSRHADRFVVAEPFLDAMATLLDDGGELYVQTDVSDRAARYRDVIAAHAAFELATESGFVPENPFGARSNREVRAEEDGLPVHRILARRRRR